MGTYDGTRWPRGIFHWTLILLFTNILVNDVISSASSTTTTFSTSTNADITPEVPATALPITTFPTTITTTNTGKPDTIKPAIAHKLSIQLTKPNKHYVFHHPVTLTANNSIFSLTIGDFSFNTSLQYYSTYKMCPSYYHPDFCQLKILNYVQNSMRTYGHTQLKECISQQWFQDSLSLRSVSIIDVQSRDPPTTTYHITTDTLITLNSKFINIVQNVDPYLNIENNSCIQRALINVVPFQEHLMHFWYTGELGDEFEDYDEYDKYEEMMNTTEASIPTLTTETPISTYFNRQPFFSPPTTNPTLPEGFPISPYYNMTHIVKENDITYYQYYLTGFPNFPTFGNFCVGIKCHMSKSEYGPVMITFLTDAITPEEYLAHDNNYWPFRHIPQMMIDLISPVNFDSGETMHKLWNSPMFGTIYQICFPAAISNNSLHINTTGTNFTHFYTKLEPAIYCVDPNKKLAKSVLNLLQRLTPNMLYPNSYKLRSQQFLGFWNINYTTLYYPDIITHTFTEIPQGEQFVMNSTHICSNTIAIGKINPSIMPSYNCSILSTKMTMSITDWLQSKRYILEQANSLANLTMFFSNYTQKFFPLFMFNSSTTSYLLDCSPSVTEMLTYAIIPKHDQQARQPTFLNHPYSYGPFPIISYRNFTFSYTSTNILSNLTTGQQHQTTYTVLYPNSTLRPTPIPLNHSHFACRGYDPLISLHYNISYGLKPTSWFTTFGAYINPSKAKRIAGSFTTGFQSYMLHYLDGGWKKLFLHHHSPMTNHSLLLFTDFYYIPNIADKCYNNLLEPCKEVATILRHA